MPIDLCPSPLRPGQALSARCPRESEAVVAGEAVGGHAPGRTARGTPGPEIGFGTRAAAFAPHRPAQPFGEHEGRRVGQAAIAVALELRSEEHTSELQSLTNLVCRLLLEKKKQLT